MIYNINEISFKSKDCKKENHIFCKYQWEGFRFQIICSCECHRKLVLDKPIFKNDSNNENNVVVELNNKGEFNK